MTPQSIAPHAGTDPARPDRSALIERHMPMARGVAGEYVGPRIGRDDARGEAYLGLIDAADRFLAEYPAYPEASFPRYAERVIRSHLRRALERAPVVRRSRDLERSAIRGGDAAPGWAPYAVAVEDLGAMPADPAEAEAHELALSACTAEERELADLLLHGYSVAQAGRRMGLGLAQARALLRGLQRALEGAFAPRGFTLPPFALAGGN